MKKYNLYILAVLPKSSFQCFIPLDFNRFCSVSGIPSHCFCVCLEGPFYTSLSFTDEITRYGSFCRFLHRPRHPSPVYSLCSFFKGLKWKQYSCDKWYWMDIICKRHPWTKNCISQFPFCCCFFFINKSHFLRIFCNFSLKTPYSVYSASFTGTGSDDKGHPTLCCYFL